MSRIKIPYFQEEIVSYQGLDWKVIGVKGDMRLLRLYGSYETVRVSVANLDLNNG